MLELSRELLNISGASVSDGLSWVYDRQDNSVNVFKIEAKGVSDLRTVVVYDVVAHIPITERVSINAGVAGYNLTPPQVSLGGRVFF